VKLLPAIAALLISSFLFAQKTSKEFQFIDTGIFEDNSHHWYGIADKGNIIQPKKINRNTVPQI